ncbi:MAG: MFS transporter [Thermoprotei archaeon]
MSAKLHAHGFTVSLFAGYSVSVMSPLVLGLVRENLVSQSLLGLLASTTLMGSLIGALVFGRLGDLFGGARASTWAAWISVLFSLISAVSASSTFFAASRIMVGLGTGAGYSLANPIASGSFPADRKGRALVLNWGGGWFLGELGAFAAGYICDSALGDQSWRMLSASTALPALLVLLIGRSSAGKTQRYPVKPRQLVASPGYGRRLAFASVNYVCEAAAFYSLSVMEPIALSYTKFPSSFHLTMLSDTLLVTGGAAGVVATYMLIDRKGRLWLNYVGYAALMAVAVAIYSSRGPQALFHVIPLEFAAQLVSWFGPSVTANIILSELWPPEVTGTAAGISSAAGRISAIVSTIIYPMLVLNSGVGVSYLYPAAFALAGLIFTRLLGVETKPDADRKP